MTLYYEDESVQLHHGDCREIFEWTRADVLVTDPPYGVHHAKYGVNEPDIAGETRTGRASDRVLTMEHVSAREDALRIWGSKPAVVFGSWRAPRPDRTRMRLIWDKGSISSGGVHPWRPSDEEIYILGDWPNPKGSGGDQPSIIRNRTLLGLDRPHHPTPKPVALMEYLVSCSPAGMIADPFAGSGSTLIAARNLGRKAIGVELEERYCELIVKRISQQAFIFDDLAI